MNEPTNSGTHEWTIEECKTKDYLHAPDDRIGLFGWEHEGLDGDDKEAGRVQIRKLIAAANSYGRLVAACEATLMFYQSWSPEWQEKWDALTGNKDASTKGLCDFVRSALAENEEDEPGS